MRHIQKRILFALAFATLFSVAYLAFFYTYYRFLDSTTYYSVVQPVPVAQKWYKPCDNVILTATRTSLVDLSSSIQTDLILKQGENTIFKVPNVRFKREATIKQGSKVVVSTSYPLPCNLADGLYYWQITVSYKVKGFERDYTAVSDTFNVNQYGISPEVVKVATMGAQLQRPIITDPSVRVITPAPTAIQNNNEAGSSAQPNQQSVTINNNQQPQSQPTPPPNPTPIPTPTPAGPIKQIIDQILPLL